MKVALVDIESCGWSADQAARLKISTRFAAGSHPDRRP